MNERSYRFLMPFCTVALLMLAACSPVASPEERRALADQIATAEKFSYHPITTRTFLLSSWRRIAQPGAPVTVYIEGDGFAWQSISEPSNDPTPTDPLALRLAARDPASNVVYLARPCQFEGIRSTYCGVDDWTGARFSRRVVDAYDMALSRILEETSATQLHLVGYSGGSVVALLAATARRDVLDVRTVAGNIDTHAWTELHDLTPMKLSRNPADSSAMLAAIPQMHFVGADDDIVPRSVAESYRNRFGNPECVAIKTVHEADHHRGWVAQWEDLLTIPLPCQR